MIYFVFCSEKVHIIKYKIAVAAANCSIFPEPFIGNLCVCVCVCVCVWNINSFDIIGIIFKAYKKCISPIKKDFKSARLLI